MNLPVHITSINKVESFLRKSKKKLITFISLQKRTQTKSYSQAGEDRIVSFLFGVIGLTHPTYCDIGANDPKTLSNTYFFYRNGSSGVCVEPNPILWKNFIKKRPRDITLNVGVGAQPQNSLSFYCFGPEADGLSTFSETQARLSEIDQSCKVREILQVPVLTINSILEKYFVDPPCFLTIDVEGLDKEILDSLDFNRHAPVVICAETHSQANGVFSRDVDYISFICSKGYTVYANTFINTIFLKNEYFSRFFR